MSFILAVGGLLAVMVRRAASVEQPPSNDIWILAGGTWNDAGIWIDEETWNDGV